MDNPSHLTQPRLPLKYTFDGHFLPDTPQDDSSESESESRCSNSSFQVIANSMVRMEIAQLEMMKKREMARLDAQRRQAELEDELTQMMLQTQAHIASIVCHTRKRKNSSDHHSTTTTTTGPNMLSDEPLLLTLLLSNII